MTVEILRKAASLMRERARSGSLAAPWTADVRQDGRAWVRAANPPYDLSMHGFGDDAQHIASWHPAVALAVADWLDTAGADLWAHGPLCGCPGDDGCHNCDDDLWMPHVRRALAVAHAYLGESA